MRLPRFFGTLALAALLSACAATGDPSQPIPSRLMTGSGAQERLVVVLPGRADSLQDLERAGIAQAVHEAWPDADVQLVALTLPYYLQGRAAERLRSEIIEPARRRGYREIWLAGASMGGMGSLLYDAYFPGDADGLFLLAPYLGERAILGEIQDAGGIGAWNPGPRQEWSEQTWQRELWRHLHGWSKQPGRASNVWLAYGDRDRLRKAMPILEPVLASDHVLQRQGGHAWKVWTPALRDILLAQTRERGAGGPAR